MRRQWFEELLVRERSNLIPSQLACRWKSAIERGDLLDYQVPEQEKRGPCHP
jgi:hypothetical protein